jgi:hypothetical protein
MIEYKLLKWYPSLRGKCSVGEVVKKPINEYTYSKANLAISPSEVENNPEF